MRLAAGEPERLEVMPSRRDDRALRALGCVRLEVRIAISGSLHTSTIDEWITYGR